MEQQPKCKAQHWVGAQDGEWGQWKDIKGVPLFDTRGDGRAWELEVQEDYARSGTNIVPANEAAVRVDAGYGTEQPHA